MLLVFITQLIIDDAVKRLIYCVVAVFQELDILNVPEKQLRLVYKPFTTSFGAYSKTLYEIVKIDGIVKNRIHQGLDVKCSILDIYFSFDVGRSMFDIHLL